MRLLWCFGGPKQPRLRTGMPISMSNLSPTKILRLLRGLKCIKDTVPPTFMPLNKQQARLLN